MDIPPCQHLLHDSDYLWCGILILNHFFFGKSSIFEGKLAPVVLLPTEIRSQRGPGAPGADRTLSDHLGETALAVAERRAQCRAQDRPADMGASAARQIERAVLDTVNSRNGKKRGKQKQHKGKTKRCQSENIFFLKGKVWSKISGLKQMIFKSFFFNGQWSASNDADQWPQTSFQREPFSRQLSVQRSLVTLLLCWADLLALRSNDREKCHFQRRFFTPTHLTLSGDCSSKHVNLRKPYQKF